MLAFREDYTSASPQAVIDLLLNLLYSRVFWLHSGGNLTFPLCNLLNFRRAMKCNLLKFWRVMKYNLLSLMRAMKCNFFKFQASYEM